MLLPTKTESVLPQMATKQPTAKPITNLTEASSRWTDLSNQLYGQQRGAMQDTLATGANQALYNRMGDLASRGAGAGSMERVASMGIAPSLQAALKGSQGVTTGLSQNLATGIQKIDLPKLQGEDMAAGQKYASELQKKSGLGGFINSFLGG